MYLPYDIDYDTWFMVHLVYVDGSYSAYSDGFKLRIDTLNNLDNVHKNNVLYIKEIKATSELS